MSAAAPPLPRIVLLVFLPFAGGYFLSYLYRSLNAIIAPDLIRELGLSAGDLGFLTAAYFLAFAAFQLPLGLLLDRFGPRRVQAGLLLSAATGAAVFSFAEGLAALAVGRALIGMGCAGGLMSSFKAIVIWLPPQRWALAQGCFLAAGGLGALAATSPAQALLGITDWRGIFAGLAGLTCLVSAAIFLVVPEREGSHDRERLGAAVAALKTIYRNRFFWRIAPVCILTFGFGLAFQGLWAAPWLKDVVGLPREAVAQALFALAALLTAGFVLTGVAADLLIRRGVPLDRVAAGGLLLYLLSQAPLALGWSGGWWLVVGGAGLLSNVGVLLYPMLTQAFPLRLAGRCNTALNLPVFGGAFLLQYAIGAAIDLWPPVAEGTYAAEAYAVAFGIPLGIAALAWGWFLVPATTCSAARGA